MATSATLQEQYEALRGGAGYVELADWSSVTITGADRQKFLHSFCTNDVKSLKLGDCREAFFTDAKGRILAHGLIDCRDEELVFVGAPNQAARLVEHLDRYIIREDVQLRDTTNERAYLHAPSLPPVPLAHRLGCSNPWALLEVASKDLAPLRDAFREQNLAPCDLAALEIIRIEAGLPLYGVDFNEHNFPQEVNRDRQAISFTKGCYLGQETVARIDALGHVNQKLVGVRFSGTSPPTAGAALMYNGAEVGRVTSAAYSPVLAAAIALAMIRRDANAVGTALDSPVGGCEVISLPVQTATT